MSKHDEILLINDDVKLIKKKKGRPRKNPIEVKSEVLDNVNTEKKKRGRKKKEKGEEEIKQKKKRGRKAALKFFSSTIRKKIPLSTLIYDNDKSILHLDIKDDKDIQSSKIDITYDVLKNEYNKEDFATLSETLNNMTLAKSINSNTENENENESESENDILCEYLDNNNIDITELYEKRLQYRLKEDNQLIENLENLHNDNNLLNKLVTSVNKKIQDKSSNISSNKDDVRKKGFFMILSEYINMTEWHVQTDVCCWWCCHTFDTIPIGLPLEWSSKFKKYRVKGIFCSFACVLAYHCDYNLNSNTKTMIIDLYKKLTGGYPVEKKEDFISMLYKNTKIKELFKNDETYKEEYIKTLSSLIEHELEKAPPRCSLKMFGGELDINEFRNASKERKIYKMIEYPMYISRDYIEEVDLQNLKNVNKNLFEKQHNTLHANTLSDKRLEEAKIRVNSSSVVVTNNSIDRFITF
jgi:hypothetical protein